MITFSEEQIMAWLSPILWPFLRVLALFSVAPVFSMRVVPMRVKIGLAFLVALCAQGVLGEQPVISVNEREALGTVAQQVAVGLAIGFSVRLVFTAVELAGEIIGLQMGLNFASFFDPTSNGQISAVARFFGHMSMLLFVNLTMGIISRVAPQMNIYAVGFPVTLTVGMLGIAATLPMLEQPVLALMQQAVDLFSAGR